MLKKQSMQPQKTPLPPCKQHVMNIISTIDIMTVLWGRLFITVNTVLTVLFIYEVRKPLKHTRYFYSIYIYIYIYLPYKIHSLNTRSSTDMTITYQIKFDPFYLHWSCSPANGHASQSRGRNSIASKMDQTWSNNEHHRKTKHDEPKPHGLASALWSGNIKF